MILAQKNDDPEFLAKAYINKDVLTTEELSLVPEILLLKQLANAAVRDNLRQHFIRKAFISSQVVKGKEEEAATYRDYFDFRNRLKV